MMLSLGGTASIFFLLFFYLIVSFFRCFSLLSLCSYCCRKASVYDKREIYCHVYIPAAPKLTVITPF